MEFTYKGRAFFVATLTAALVAGLAGCGGDGGSDAAAPSSQATQATVTGVVKDASGPVANVQVQIGADSALTDAQGQYTLRTAPQAQAGALVKFSKADHALQAKALPQALVAGQSVQLDTAMLAVAQTLTFNPATAQTLVVTGTQASVSLPANALVHANGQAATGTVTAVLTPINPAVDSRVMPGALENGSGNPIESWGALQVNFSDASGALNLAAGQTATLRIPAVSRGGSSLPGSVPLFYYDEATGRWVEQGSATLAGTAASPYYEGQVSHFSVWNADKRIDTVFVNGCLANAQGVRLSQGLVQGDGVDYIGRNVVQVNANGDFRIGVKRNASTRLAGQGFVPQAYSDGVTVAVADVDVTLPSCLVVHTAGTLPFFAFTQTPAPTTVPPTTTPVPSPAAYVGSYSGSYSGAETGTWAVVMGNTGTVTGSGYSNTFNTSFVITGTVSATGAVALNAAVGSAGSSQFLGTVGSNGAVSGTWSYVGGGGSGSFSGTRN